MPIIFYILDTLTILSALLASWLWYMAGSRSVRRISRHELLDSQDINRLVVAMNRSAILNRRAAMATAASALFIAIGSAASLIMET